MDIPTLLLVQRSAVSGKLAHFRSYQSCSTVCSQRHISYNLVANNQSCTFAFSVVCWKL